MYCFSICPSIVQPVMHIIPIMVIKQLHSNKLNKMNLGPIGAAWIAMFLSFFFCQVGIPKIEIHTTSKLPSNDSPMLIFFSYLAIHECSNNIHRHACSRNVLNENVPTA